MKIHFQTEDYDCYGKGPNLLAALGDLEEKLKVLTGSFSVILDDVSIDWNELVESLWLDTFTLEEHRSYLRSNFMDEDDNFTLTIEKDD